MAFGPSGRKSNVRYGSGAVYRLRLESGPSICDLAVMAKRAALSFTLALAACAPNAIPAETVDARVFLPDARIKKGDYVRYYMLATITSDADLPFSTSHSFLMPEPREVWVAVYARTPSVWTTAPAGMHIVEKRQDFPEFVHGGCDAVNVVVDAHTGETLGSWCNVDDRENLDGMPRRIPTYIPDGSPLREAS